MKLRCVVCSTQVEVLKSMEMLLENTNLVNSVTCYSTLEEIKDELRDGKEADILFIDVCAEEEKCFENDKEKNEIKPPLSGEVARRSRDGEVAANLIQPLSPGCAEPAPPEGKP